MEKITAAKNLVNFRSRAVAMVTDLWRVLAKIDTPRLHSLLWHSTTTTDGNIAAPIIAITSTMDPLRLLTISSNLVQNPWELVA